MSTTSDQHETTPTAHAEHTASHIHLPDPSIWPPVMGLGVLLLGFGIVLTPILLIIGVIFFAAGLGGWIADAVREGGQGSAH